jgi:hypothetical protein
MTMSDTSSGKPLSPAELFTQYLQRQAAAQAEGLGFAETPDAVEPHDGVPVQPVDPKRAWEDALAVLPHLAANAPSLGVPPEWPALVAAQEPAIAVPFCLGNYPQMVRHLHPLLGSHLPALRAATSRQATPALRDWALRTRSYPQVLLAAAVLRTAGDFDTAAELLRADAPAQWQALRSNELAALAWQRGDTASALQQWQALGDSVPVLFNRGMAHLFLGERRQGAELLRQVVARLPETSAWHHLAQLYLALAGVQASPPSA